LRGLYFPHGVLSAVNNVSNQLKEHKITQHNYRQIMNNGAELL